jgi:hypothetical protein
VIVWDDSSKNRTEPVGSNEQAETLRIQPETGVIGNSKNDLECAVFSTVGESSAILHTFSNLEVQ